MSALPELVTLTTQFPEEPPAGAVVLLGKGQDKDEHAWQRRDGFGSTPRDFRWFPAGSYLPGPSSNSDYTYKPLTWRQLVAEGYGVVTVIWTPPEKPS